MHEQPIFDGLTMIPADPSSYVLDTGPLSHFAESQWLGALKLVLDGTPVLVPDVVAAELRAGSLQHPHLVTVVRLLKDGADADVGAWIEVVPLETDDQQVAFARYTRLLVGADGRNVGECGVLALAQTTPGAVAVLDDRAARNAGKDHHVKVRGTLGLLCEAVRRGRLTIVAVSAVADDLLQHDYRLPFSKGGFERWADENGLLEH